MAAKRSKTFDLFDEGPIDPVVAATGAAAPKPTTVKRKAGFYLSEETLERFGRKFHELKLAGVSIDNKSALAEKALNFALDDIDRGEDSRLLAEMKTGSDSKTR